jgi:hypothetical protein
MRSNAKKRLAMRKRARLLISNAVLIMIIGAIFFAGKSQLSSAQNAEFKTYQLAVYCGNSGVATVIFGHKVTSGGTVGRPLMGNKAICAGNCRKGAVTIAVTIADALAGLPAEVSAALKAKVAQHQENAAAGKGRPIACLGKGTDCEKYTGEITCDCNADGKDDSKKSFESCGPPSDFPRSFRSKCQDWVHVAFLGPEYHHYSYKTEDSLQKQGRAYLEEMETYCPVLGCKVTDAECEFKARTALEECKKFKGSLRCEREANEARDECSREYEKCKENIERSGPAPPIPRPLPTPTPPTFRLIRGYLPHSTTRYQVVFTDVSAVKASYVWLGTNRYPPHLPLIFSSHLS